MLRHTHATELIRSGVAIEVVARLLTHRSSTTTSQIYIHLDVGRRARSPAPGRRVGPRPEPARERRRARPPPPASPGRHRRRRRRASRPSTPRTAGTPAGSASLPGAAATSPASAASTSRGCARRSSGGPGSVSAPATPSPPSTPAPRTWPGFSLFLADATAEVDGFGRDHPGAAGSVPGVDGDRARGRPTRSSTRSRFVKVFLEWGRRHDTLPGLPADAVIYEEEVARPADAAPEVHPRVRHGPARSPRPTWPGCATRPSATS